MLGQIGTDLVKRAGGDLGAVAQSRHQLAIVDDKPPESGFGGLRRAAIIPDFAKHLIGGLADGVALTFLDPHGYLPRFASVTVIKGQASGCVNHKRSGQELWAYAHYRARREKYEISTGSVTRITSGASIMPVTTTTASGFCTWDPIPADIAAGNSPTPAITQVISTGRS
jgi:hypothetical protein